MLLRFVPRPFWRGVLVQDNIIVPELLECDPIDLADLFPQRRAVVSKPLAGPGFQVQRLHQADGVRLPVDDLQHTQPVGPAVIGGEYFGHTFSKAQSELSDPASVTL